MVQRRLSVISPGPCPIRGPGGAAHSGRKCGNSIENLRGDNCTLALFGVMAQALLDIEFVDRPMD